MSLLDTYLRGSDVLRDGCSPIAQTNTSKTDPLVEETERAVAEAEAEECAALAPFETAKLARVLKSEIPNVSDDAWTRFVFAMKTAQPSAVSASNALGMFELKTRRLADLGLVKDVKRARSPLGRLTWVGTFVPPLTQRKFLSGPDIQYRAFVNSMKSYIEGLRAGSVPCPDGGFPRGMSLSGALAVLHRGGPNGLKDWNDEGDRFEDTVALFERANGIF